MGLYQVILAVIGSSVISSLITSVFTKSMQNKSDKLQYVTTERKLWRDEIRQATLSLHSIDTCSKVAQFKSVAEAKAFFQIRLNPYAKEDNNLLDCIVKEGIEKISDANLKKIDEYVAILLKHDWERVKLEARAKHSLIIYYSVVIAIWLAVVMGLLDSCVNYIEEISEYASDGMLNEVSLKSLMFATIVPLIPFALRMIWGFTIWVLNTSSRIGVIPEICRWIGITYRKTITK